MKLRDLLHAERREKNAREFPEHCRRWMTEALPGSDEPVTVRLQLTGYFEIDYERDESHGR